MVCDLSFNTAASSLFFICLGVRSPRGIRVIVALRATEIAQLGVAVQIDENVGA